MTTTLHQEGSVEANPDAREVCKDLLYLEIFNSQRVGGYCRLEAMQPERRESNSHVLLQPFPLMFNRSKTITKKDYLISRGGSNQTPHASVSLFVFQGS